MQTWCWRRYAHDAWTQSNYHDVDAAADDDDDDNYDDDQIDDDYDGDDDGDDHIIKKELWHFSQDNANSVFGNDEEDLEPYCKFCFAKKWDRYEIYHLKNVTQNGISTQYIV